MYRSGATTVRIEHRNSTFEDSFSWLVCMQVDLLVIRYGWQDICVAFIFPVGRSWFSRQLLRHNVVNMTPNNMSIIQLYHKRDRSSTLSALLEATWSSHYRNHERAPYLPTENPITLPLHGIFFRLA
jgi:hypothetical protein